jgi:ribosomal protein S18 acetylase RimI-like enzyme
MDHDQVELFYKKVDEIPPPVLRGIHELIVKGGAVGTSLIMGNLRSAYLIGYALYRGRVVGTVTHKNPKEEDRKKIEAATGRDLSGYLERGYHSVEPEFRDREIADDLIKGLIERSAGRKIYVTIRMDNVQALRLAEKNGTILAATFIYERTGNEIGVFTNQATQSLC